jgi:hypothetical protein
MKNLFVTMALVSVVSCAFTQEYKSFEGAGVRGRSVSVAPAGDGVRGGFMLTFNEGVPTRAAFADGGAGSSGGGFTDGGAGSGGFTDGGASCGG